MMAIMYSNFQLRSIVSPAVNALKIYSPPFHHFVCDSLDGGVYCLLFHRLSVSPSVTFNVGRDVTYEEARQRVEMIE